MRTKTPLWSLVIFVQVLLFLIIGGALEAAAQSVAKKKLTVENIMGLLSGGVPVTRVSYLVLDRGIDFPITPRLEQAFRDSGADESLIMALHKQPAATGSAGTAEPTASVVPPSQETATAKPAEPPRTAPPPGTPATGLLIKSQPPGVAIFVDDQPKGQTDPEDGHLEITPLRPGKHQLRATHEGYQDQEGTVFVTAQAVEETPVWLSKLEAPPPAAPPGASLPSGTKFLVRHTHLAVEGVTGPGYCEGWLIVNVGYVRFISTNSPHTYLLNSSEIRDAKASSATGAFQIKLDFGRKYDFVAVNDKGQAVSPGPVLTEIQYSMGK
jgi:hypothetical protein